jgi:hypothetical protein
MAEFVAAGSGTTDFISRNNMVRRSAARLLSGGFGPK